MAKIKAEKSRWLDVPQRDYMAWLSDWLVSSMVLKAQVDLKRSPKRIRLSDSCLRKNKDGSATLHFDAE